MRLTPQHSRAYLGLPEDEQGVLIKIISAYVRDYRAKQAYAM